MSKCQYCIVLSVVLQVDFLLEVEQEVLKQEATCRVLGGPAWVKPMVFVPMVAQ